MQNGLIFGTSSLKKFLQWYQIDPKIDGKSCEPSQNEQNECEVTKIFSRTVSSNLGYLAGNNY